MSRHLRAVDDSQRRDHVGHNEKRKGVFATETYEWGSECLIEIGIERLALTDLCLGMLLTVDGEHVVIVLGNVSLS